MLLVILLWAGGTSASEPLWPLDLGHRHLTSNFMEYRQGRFHAGIDLRTEGRTGFAVRAAEDGHVSRLRASARGYGQAVYLRGDSGRTYVYGHLERMADPLRDHLRREQRARGRYTVDLALPESALRVRRGDVLALSGQSGTPGPHLHFEVRDEQQRPLDPLKVFAVPDHRPPEIRSVRALPAPHPAARIEGTTEPHVIKAGQGLRGELPPLTVSGPVAFTARIVERSDALGYRLEPSLVQVWVDDELQFEKRNDSFAFAGQGQMLLEWIETGDGREQWLHRRPENRLPGRSGGAWYLGAAGDGLAPGSHRVRLRAEDRAGNAAEAVWTMMVVDGPGAVRGSRLEAATADASVFADASALDASAADATTADASAVDVSAVGASPRAAVPPDAAVIEASTRTASNLDTPAAAWMPALVGQVLALGDGTVRHLAPPGCWRGAADRSGELETILHQVHPDVVLGWVADGHLHAAVELYRVDTGAPALDARLLRKAQGLVSLGPAGLFMAWEWPAERAPWLSLEPDPGTGTVTTPAVALAQGGMELEVPGDVGVYRRRTDGTWTYLARPRAALRAGPAGDGSAASSAQSVSDTLWFLPLAEPGLHRIMRDVDPPWLGSDTLRVVSPGPAATAGGDAVTPPRWAIVDVPVVDRGSGVDTETIAVWLDGEPLIVEPDPTRDRILVELPDDTLPGRRVLGVEVGDRAGRFTARQIVLDLRP
ncbi:MAG: M23 family metallopeptidase [Candidatus Krumholzibacteriia bacterium]